MFIKINTKIGETIAGVKPDEVGIILNSSVCQVSVELQKMSCFSGNEVRVIQVASLYNPLFFNSIV